MRIAFSVDHIRQVVLLSQELDRIIPSFGSKTAPSAGSMSGSFFANDSTANNRSLWYVFCCYRCCSYRCYCYRCCCCCCFFLLVWSTFCVIRTYFPSLTLSMVNVLFFIPFVLTYLRLVLCRSAHVYFCQTLARGQVTYDPRKHISGTTPILESQAHRLALIESILAMNARTDSQGNLCWPMCLSSPLHALVTSNLVCEPVVSHSSTDSGEDACAPERILVQSFLRSISEALMKPDSIKAMIGTSFV